MTRIPSITRHRRGLAGRALLPFGVGIALVPPSRSPDSPPSSASATRTRPPTPS